MRYLLLWVLLATGIVSAAQSTRTFTGTITDSECGSMGHSRMQMGPTDAECVRACIEAHGATYVLVVGSTEYALSDQAGPARFVAQRVTVTGTLDEKSKTIHVASIAAAAK